MNSIIKQRPALLGGDPVVSTPFPNWPIFNEQEVEAVKAVVESGRWWSNNPIIEEFESSFAKFQGTSLTLAVTNGAQSLEVILRALAIGPGDEVIVPAYTFIATATAVLMVGAVPILVDVQANTMTLDPNTFREAITSRTRAVIPVHLAGVVGVMDDIIAIAEEHQIFVIEDCAHAHGASFKGRPVGSLGIAGAFSFQASKTMTSGEGGAIVTNDADLFGNCWSLRNCGRLPTQPKYQHYQLGSNYRMTAFQAAILQVQLQRLAEQIPRRLCNVKHLDKGLSQIDGITTQYRDLKDSAPGYLHIFYYKSEAFSGLPRSLLVKALHAEGIPCAEACYPPIHHTALFQERNFKANGQSMTHDLTGYPLPDYSRLSLPNSERIAVETIWIPHEVLLGEPKQIQAIVDAVTKIQQYSYEFANLYA